MNLEVIVNLSESFTCVEGDFGVLGIGISLIRAVHDAMGLQRVW